MLLLVAQSFTAQMSKLTYFKGNLAEATQLAKQENKMVIAEFYATWCSRCKNFKAKTLSDEKVINELNKNFIILEIDGEKEEKAFVAKHPMKSYPQLFLIDSEGKILKMDKGFMNVNEFLTFLNRN